MHHGTIAAKDYEFSNIENIMKEYNISVQNKLLINSINEKIKKMPPETRKALENEKIISVLSGDLKVENILSTNKIFNNFIKQFKKINPKGNIHYQGVISVQFRDFLIENPELKHYIDDYLKNKRLYANGDKKHQKVYQFIDSFYQEHDRYPNTLELYQTFLNFKSYELRGKLNYFNKKYN